MSYQCYLLLFTPFVLQFMSYQCYLLLFTPIVLQEVHLLSMLFVISYSICFAGGSCLINVTELNTDYQSTEMNTDCQSPEMNTD
jgi:hypothetical protein